MIHIEMNRELKLENVLSLRGKMTQSQVQQEMTALDKYLDDKEARKNGPIITATFSMEVCNEQPLIDMEILVPLASKIDVDKKYVFKEIFHLVNAVYARHKGNPATLQNTYNEMTKYINDNNLQQITVPYNVNIVDMQNTKSIDNIIIDIYIGINPSVL